MPTIPSEKIAEVRDRIDIEQVIGRTVRLKKQGRRVVGLCPFHQEKTPSFSIDPVNKLYHCFGCGVGGDIFDFVMRQEALEFPEAVRYLAREAGVDLPEREETQQERRARSERAKLIEVNKKAQQFFREGLKADARAQTYLVDERGLDQKTIDRFGLGFAPQSWQALSDHLERTRTDMRSAVRLGLVASRQKGGTYDRLRGRVVFPIRSRDGDILGFGARRADWLFSEDEDRGPKYLNSPESPVYDKSSIFYGMDFARDEIRKSRRALLVEGYFDVIALHQRGFGTAVACCGTALSTKHAAQLKKLCDEVVTLYDGDEAGMAATRRAAETLLKAGLSVRVLSLPKEDDPDTYIQREGPEAMAERLKNAPGAVDFFVGREADEHRGGGIAGLVKTVEGVRSLITSIADPLARDLTIEGAARILRVAPEVLRRHLGAKREGPGRNRGQAPRPSSPPAAAGPPPPRLELTLLRQILEDPDRLTTLEENDGLRALSHSAVQAAIRGALDAKNTSSAYTVHEALARMEAAGASEETLKLTRETLVSQLPEEDDFNECLKRLLRTAIEARLRALRERIASTQKTDPEAAARLSAEFASEMIRYKSSLS